MIAKKLCLALSALLIAGAFWFSAAAADDDADFLNMKKCKIDKIDDCPTGPKNKKKKDEKPAQQKNDKQIKKEASVKITGVPEGSAVDIFAAGGDGKKVAECKLPCSVNLPEGNYVAKAMHVDDDNLIAREFNAQNGKETAFELTLTKYGKLFVTSDNKSLEIIVFRNDGKSKTRQVPFVLSDLPCNAGAEVHIKTAPYEKYLQKVKIACGKTTEVYVNPLFALLGKIENPYTGEDVRIYKASVPQYAPQWGGSAKDAKINIVWFVDLSDPIAQTEKKSIDAAMARFGDKARIIFRHFPVGAFKKTTSGKPDAGHISSRAAAAVMKLGGSVKFWTFVDLLVSEKAVWRELENVEMKNALAEMAQNAGVKKADFLKLMDEFPEELSSQIDADVKEALGFGLTENAIFANGKYLRPASSSSEWLPGTIDRLILPSVSSKLKGVGTLKDVYAELVKDGTPPANLDKFLVLQPSPGDDVSTGSAPMKGDPNAKITIIQISDFQCPFCAKIEKTIDEIMRNYQGKVKLYWMNYPLPFHSLAKRAAIAAFAAGEQGKFWEMHKMLMDVQGDWAYEKEADADKKFAEYAAAAGFNVERFKKAMANPMYEELVEADKKKAFELGVSGTPTFFINGVKLVGAQPYEEFKKIIDQELKKTK